MKGNKGLGVLEIILILVVMMIIVTVFIGG